MKYVIIGAGPAGIVAAERLRKLDTDAQILVIGEESDPPYSRMAIPYLLIHNIDEYGTYLRKNAVHYSSKNIPILVDKVNSVDTKKKRLSLASGGFEDYDRLLVASGSRPMTPPIPGIDHDCVTSCWTLEDARKITATIQPDASVVLIGAGFIGCIILEALVKSGANLTVVEMGNRMVPRMLDETCGTLLEKWCVKKGINVMTSSQVEAVVNAENGVVVKISGDREVSAELVISAAGVRPNAEFLEGCGVELSDGAVLIDEYMQSSVSGVFAAGDVACGKDFSTGAFSVQAIQPTAVEHARVAASNMHNLGSVKYQGAVLMNVLDTLGLISASYGLWEGVPNGDCATLVDKENFRYLQLQFEGNVLVGANALGLTQHVGVLRGLIQGRFDLASWKDRLMKNPLLIMEAYLAITSKQRASFS